MTCSICYLHDFTLFIVSYELMLAQQYRRKLALMECVFMVGEGWHCVITSIIDSASYFPK